MYGVHSPKHVRFCLTKQSLNVYAASCTCSVRPDVAEVTYTLPASPVKILYGMGGGGLSVHIMIVIYSQSEKLKMCEKLKKKSNFSQNSRK